MRKLSKQDLIKALEKAEKNPRDLIGLIGEFGFVGLSGAGTAALTSALLATATTTTITAPVLGSTFLGTLIGATVTVTTLTAAPLLGILAGGLVGIVITYFLLRLVKSGFNNDRKRTEYIKNLKEKIENYDRKSTTTISITNSIANLSGIYALLLKLNAVTVDGVATMFAGINNGSIDIEFALDNAKQILKNLSVNQKALPSPKK